MNEQHAHMLNRSIWNFIDELSNQEVKKYIDTHKKYIKMKSNTIDNLACYFCKIANKKLFDYVIKVLPEYSFKCTCGCNEDYSTCNGGEDGWFAWISWYCWPFWEDFYKKNKTMTTVYFSSLLKQKKYLPFYNRLVKLFKDNNLTYEFIEGTKDIWMRDFMPIRSSDDKYICFNYHPKYLENFPKLITNGKKIAEQFRIETFETNIKLDGGNFVRYDKTAIITSRVFKENPQYKKQNLIDIIKFLLKLNKIIIIEEENDDYGHSDGMVRFVDNNTVLINEYSKKHLKYKKKLTDVLEREGLKYIEIPSTDSLKNAIGLYINYLQFDDIIILPQFNISNDIKALNKFKSIFKDYKILQLDCTEIAKDGGVLNCISWTM